MRWCSKTPFLDYCRLRIHMSRFQRFLFCANLTRAVGPGYYIPRLWRSEHASELIDESSMLMPFKRFPNLTLDQFTWKPGVNENLKVLSAEQRTIAAVRRILHSRVVRISRHQNPSCDFLPKV